MMRLSFYFTLLALATTSTFAAEQELSATGDSPSSVGERRLSFGFSFTSLLFHLCHPPPPGSPHCQSHHHHPLPPLHCPCTNWYCEKDPSLPICSSSESGYDGSGSEGGEYGEEGSEEQDGGQAETVYEGSGTDTGEANSESGVGSGGNWFFSPLAYVLLASAVATVGIAGALLMRDRKNSKAMAGEGVDDRALNADGGESAAADTYGASGSVFGNMSTRVGMMIGGAALATAGLAGAMFGGRSREEESHDGLHGSVSRRLDIIESGGDALSAPYYAETRSPSFIQVPHERGENDTVSLAPGGDIEVEAAPQPSSYAI